MAALTDLQELLLVIFIVIIFKSIFLVCLCKIRKCSEMETNYSMTPGAMCRYLCNKQEERQETNVRPTNSSNNNNDKPPPPYCAPPQYEEAIKNSTECWDQTVPPPAYTICIPENIDVGVTSGVCFQ